MPPHHWRIRDRVLTVSPRPLVLGIVNVTPDSFSDGGHHPTTDLAVAHALELVRQGADLLDVGGESTRPGSDPVPVEEELRRVLPVVQALVGQVAVPISLDTSKAAVARAGLAAGAHLVNDVTGLSGDPDMPEVVREFGAGAIVMHMQGTPQTMHLDPRYEDVTAEVGRFFEQRLRDLAAAGIAGECVVLDPGVSFGKTTAHNLQLLAQLPAFQRFGRPVCLGVSRKGFLGKITGRPIDERLAASVAVACDAVVRGAAQVLRVHDVAATRDAVEVLTAIRTGGLPM
jgi:dihydropteroate synthase